MSTLIKGTALRLIDLGVKVDKAAAALPQTATGTLFTITGGKVLVTALVGTVTTAVQAQATVTKLVATPSGSGTVNDLCATLDLTGTAAGSLLIITGLVTDAMVKTTGGGIPSLGRRLILAPGVLGLNTAASSTGATSWTLTYIPLDDGATVS